VGARNFKVREELGSHLNKGGMGVIERQKRKQAKVHEQQKGKKRTVGKIALNKTLRPVGGEVVGKHRANL